MEVRSPQNKAEWTAYYDLRFRVLREPWNQIRGSERDSHEEDGEHFAVFNAHLIIAVGRLDQLDSSTGQVRFMAVMPSFQGKQIGRLLLDKIMKRCEEKKLHVVILHAREIAIPFYERLGFQLVEKSHLLFGEIQHFLMEKRKASEN
jgi:ribosomal protein S18 acetylase RimI-like enzyme